MLDGIVDCEMLDTFGILLQVFLAFIALSTLISKEFIFSQQLKD
jgi:hypothetical protein